MQITLTNNFKPSFKANRIPQEEANYLNKKMMGANTVDIFCHAAADEDAYNSAKTLYLYLESKGKTPRIISSDEPDNFGFDKQRYNILTTDNINSETEKADLATCVDFSKRERVLPNVQEYLSKYSNDKIIGFDHHSCCSDIIPSTMHVTKQYQSVKDIPFEEPKNFYVDSSSKSCSAVLYRFFNAIKEPISREQLKSMFCGMSDDMSKSECIKFANDSDQVKIVDLPKIKDDTNTKEVYYGVVSQLEENDKIDIISHLDVLATLTPEEKAFQKRLFEDAKVTENGKFAYVELPPDDEQWMLLGADNKRTSRILRDFRIRAIEHEKDDPIINKMNDKYKNVQAAAVFYSRPEDNVYQISIHTKEDYAKKFNDYIRKNLYPELTAGGHANRGGGRIFTLDKNACKEWVNYFKIAGENIDY